MSKRYEVIYQGIDDRGPFVTARGSLGKRFPDWVDHGGARWTYAGPYRQALWRRPWWNPFRSPAWESTYRPPVEPAPAPPPEPEPMPAMTSNVFLHATGLVYVAPCREHSVVLCLPASGVVSQVSTADAR